MPTCKLKQTICSTSSIYLIIFDTFFRIFFNGGDQSRHSRAWLNDDGSDSDIMRALRTRFANGAVVAGTSAGCAIQADPSFGNSSARS